MENLTIVGITGSFGKTTTKQILQLILRDRFHTYATPGNVNSDIGVATTILENIGPLTDVFIVEMGAYKLGEIRKVCEIVPPDISIITGINEQHLSLFGSIQNTLRAKYEIIQYAKPDAKVILNGDNEFCLSLAGKSEKKEIFYSTTKQLDLWASDIKSKGERIVFNVHEGTKTQRFDVKILGEHNVSNVLAATAVARQLGMSLEQIAHELEKQSKSVKIGRLSVKKSRFGYQVIDDSYNSNPAGFSAALDLLSNFKGGKKILVTIGILELGSTAEELIYKDLSKKIVKHCDVLVTTSKRLLKNVQKEDEKFSVIFDTGVSKQIDFLTHGVGKGDIVLFEGPNIRLIHEVLRS